MTLAGVRNEMTMPAATTSENEKGTAPSEPKEAAKDTTAQAAAAASPPSGEAVGVAATSGVTKPNNGVNDDTPNVDEFGLPIRKSRRREPVEEEDSDDAEFVDASPGVGDDDRERNRVVTAVAAIEEKVRRERESSPVVERSRSRGQSVGRRVLEEKGEQRDAEALETVEETGKVDARPKTPTAPDSVQVDTSEAAAAPKEKDREKETPQSPVKSSEQRKSVRQSVPMASEWSHMQIAPKKDEEADADELEWQTMPAYAPFDIYDDDNKLIAKEAHDYEDDMMQYGTLGGAGKGYTRVQLDEDAQSQTSLDDNTAYLFKDAGKSTLVTEEDEESRDALGQMQATKELLTEGQRIAYVGTVRLTMIEMFNDVEKLERTKKAKKAIEFAAASLLMWSQKVMIRLYAHMEIGQDEQIMIEQLTEHGVQAEDLVPALMINARVKNPVKEEEKVEEVDEKATDATSRPSESSSRLSISSTSTKRESVASPKPKSISTEDAQSLTIKSPSLNSQAPSTPGLYDEHTPRTPNFPDVKTPSEIQDAKTLDIDIRWTVLCDLFLLLIADAVYDSRSRRLLERVGEHLQVSWLEICRFEKRVTDALEMQEAAEKENWNEDEHMETRKKAARNRRLVVMGLATVGGGLVIGLSAGLLAPLIGAGLAAGFSTIGVAGTGGFLAGAGGAAIVTTTGVVTGSTIGVRAANRRTGAVKTFEYRPLHNNKRANLIVTIAGWMNGKVDDVRLPFSTVDPIMGDIYSIYWEPEMLQSMGQTISILATEALTQTLQQVLSSTFLFALMAALQLPVLLTKLAYLIDNPWNVSLARADLAGLILADSLIDRNLGSRPITLVGFSLGARVIYSCLQELAKKGQTGILQNVYIFGTPVIANKQEFLKCRTVVAGRFLNGYATNDWILAYLFRITGGGIAKVAGLTAIDNVPNIENVNVTEWVPGHMAYRAAMPRLLREVGWEVESDEFTEIEDPDPDNHEKRQRELINEIEAARRDLEEKQGKEGKDGKKKWGFWKKKKTEKKEWEMYDERLKQEPVEIEEPELKEGELEKRAEGVLFDIEAIRKEVKELAGQDIEVRQLESTLPPMRITMDSRASSRDATPDPPMLRATKSHNDSVGVSSSSSATHSTAAKSTFDDDYGYPPTNGHTHNDDDITMSFDVPPPRSSNATPATASTSAFPEPERPPLKSRSTAPAPPPVVNMNPEYNAWDDDDDFGQEKEIKMTFA